MKNNNKPDLEHLLDDLEHAGRDSRRRDDLAAMIDNMAAAESHRHGFWWWSSRVAAAACVLFFISTAVRVWFIPTDKQEPLVAEAITPTQYTTTPAFGHTSLNEGKQERVSRPLPEGGVARRAGVGASRQNIPQTEADTIVEATLMEEYLAEEQPDTLPTTPDTIAATPIEAIAQPVVSLAFADTDPDPEPQTEPQAEPRRRSFLASILRQPEPDDMTGAVLAFRIL